MVKVKMKLKIISVLLLITLLSVKAFAVPACPYPMEVKQPDGTKIKIQKKGDEFFGWTEDLQGYTVAQDSKSKEWVYASYEGGNRIQATKYQVGKIDPTTINGISRNLKADKFSTRSYSKRMTLQSEHPKKVIISSGTVKNLVILVAFSDLDFVRTKQEFEDLFNKRNYNTTRTSVKDFYLENSYGALEIDSIITYVKLDKGYAYYGENDIWGDDKRPREMVREAIMKLDAQGFDFTQCDSDGDKVLDILTVVHAGEGEEAYGDYDTIWSHQWNIGQRYLTHDNIYVFEYNTVPELYSTSITGIGVICHELGHVIGMPDLYDTTYSSRGAGAFCLMASGSWNGYGYVPSHMSAWCKYAMGWAKPIVIDEEGQYSIGDSVKSNTAFYKLSGDTFKSREYFLIENRQGTGFDRSLPGTKRGVLIWHIDESIYDNSNPGHYKVDLEEADGSNDLALNRSSGNDLHYFREGNNTEFADFTIPSSRSYSGEMTGKPVKHISDSEEIMYFTVGDGVDDFMKLKNIRYYPNPIRPSKGFGYANMNFTDMPAGTTIKIYTLTGKLVNTLKADSEGIALWNGKNESGNNVASGIYLVHIEKNNNRRIIKIAVER